MASKKPQGGGPEAHPANKERQALTSTHIS